MINYKVKTDRYGNELIVFEVLRGDTFSLSISLKSNDEIVSRETIKKVVYKQSDENYNEIYSKEFEYNEEIGRYILVVDSEETKNFEPDVTYIYEIEVTLDGGTVVTPTQSKIKFKEEIK